MGEPDHVYDLRKWIFEWDMPHNKVILTLRKHPLKKPRPSVKPEGDSDG